MFKRLFFVMLPVALVGCASTLPLPAINEKTISQAEQSTVAVNVGKGNAILAAAGIVPHGSGTIVKVNGKNIVLTAGHVTAAAKAEALSVVTSDDVKHRANVISFTNNDSEDVVGQQPDWALLDVEGIENLPAIPVSCAKLPIGTEVFTFGNPFVLKGVATWGHVASNKSPTYDNAPQDGVVLDIAISPGNSGGGVFEVIEGKTTLVGIVLQLVRRVNGIGIMMPTSVICDSIK